MEKVVYLLGAGFSALAGIPVMRDFLIRSKDLFASNPEKFQHFEQVFQTIRAMHVAKTYYSLDLLNIEEILSILEMEDVVSGEDRSSLFKNYVKDVVAVCTPQVPAPIQFYRDQPARMWARFEDGFFGPPAYPIARYGVLVAALLKLRWEWRVRFHQDGRHEFEGVSFRNADDASPSYSVVTLNYDRLIENSIEHIRKNFKPADDRAKQLLDRLAVAKLHGSVESDIVAPTWRKLNVPAVQNQWRIAYDALSQTNHLRIIGYSLSPTDSHLRYLLSAAVIRSANLKRIDVICLDPDGTVQERYKDFICYKFVRFANADVREYLPAHTEPMGWQLARHSGDPGGTGSRTYWCDYAEMEKHHEQFMRDHAQGA